MDAFNRGCIASVGSSSTSVGAIKKKQAVSLVSTPLERAAPLKEHVIQLVVGHKDVSREHAFFADASPGIQTEACI